MNMRTGRVSHDVVNTLLEDQKNLAAHIGAKIQIALGVGRFKLKVNIARSQYIARKTSHSLGQVGQMIFMRIDGPNDITHRAHQLRRTRGDLGERLVSGGSLPTDTLANYFAEDGTLRQTRSDVVVQISGDAGAHALQLQQPIDSIPVNHISA